MLRAQALLPENDKRKEKYKKVPSLLVILILSNSIFRFINLGVPLKQISEKEHVDDEMNLIKLIFEHTTQLKVLHYFSETWQESI